MIFFSPVHDKIFAFAAIERQRGLKVRNLPDNVTEEALKSLFPEVVKVAITNFGRGQRG